MNHDPVLAERVIDGVWHLRSIPGANCYLVDLEAAGFALVDAGTPGAGAAIVQRLAQLDVAPTTLLLTHRHWDHAGGAAMLRDTLGLRVVIGDGDVEHGHVSGDRQPPRFVRRMRGGRAAVPAVVDEALSMHGESEVMTGLVAIPSPGHTRGSTCYLLPDRGLIFVGDLTLNSGDRLSRPLPISNDDTAMQERSLAAIAARAPAHGAPGHGDPLVDVFGDWMHSLASMPPAPGGSLSRVLRNPRAAFRFARRLRR